MRTQRRVFEILSESTKVELQNEKTKLSAAQDLAKSIVDMKAHLKKVISADKLMVDSFKNESKPRKEYDKLREDALKLVKEWDGITTRFWNTTDSGKKMAKELGVDLYDIKEFNESSDVYEKVDRKFEELKDRV